jgi:hypothetical protein
VFLILSTIFSLLISLSDSLGFPLEESSREALKLFHVSICLQRTAFLVSQVPPELQANRSLSLKNRNPVSHALRASPVPLVLSGQADYPDQMVYREWTDILAVTGSLDIRVRRAIKDNQVTFDCEYFSDL